MRVPTLNPLRRPSQQSASESTGQSTGSALSNTYEATKKETTKVISFGANIFLLLSGLCVTGGMGLAKSLAPDHTFVDKFSLVGILGGIVTSTFGIFRLWKGYSQIAEAQNVKPVAVPTPRTISETLKQKTIQALTPLSNMTELDEDFKLSKKVLEAKDPALLDPVLDLLDCYTNDEFKIGMIQNQGRSESCFEHIDGNNKSALESEIKERIAVLLAYAVRVTPRATNGDFTNERLKRILKIIGLDKIENVKDINPIHILPPEFGPVYKAALAYKDRTIQDLNLADLKTKLGTSNSDTRKDAEGTIEKFADQYNYLKVLREAITFVQEAEKAQRTGQAVDKNLAKKATLLRSALIAGLKLDKRQEVNAHLEDTLKSVNEKIAKAEEQKNKLETMLRETNQYSFEVFELEDNEKFYASNIGLIELK